MDKNPTTGSIIIANNFNSFNCCSFNYCPFDCFIIEVERFNFIVDLNFEDFKTNCSN